MGKFMDPLADKLIVMAALVMLTRLGRVASGVVILLLAREFIVSGLRTIAISEGMVIDASQGGKWKTSLQVTAIVALLIHYTHRIDFGFVVDAGGLQRGRDLAALPLAGSFDGVGGGLLPSLLARLAGTDTLSFREIEPALKVRAHRARHVP